VDVTATVTTALERIIEFVPAFDRRDPDPKKNYGIHDVELRMVLKGEKGAVQFVLYTNWQLPHVAREERKRTAASGLDEMGIKVRFEPMPADLGYHSPVPMYEGQEPIGATRVHWEDGEFDGKRMKLPKFEPTDTFDPCPYLDGKPCYYDGSGLNAERIYNVLLAEGSDGVWRELESYYRETFENEAAAE